MAVIKNSVSLVRIAVGTENNIMRHISYLLNTEAKSNLI